MLLILGEAPSRQTRGMPPLSGMTGRRLSALLGVPRESWGAAGVEAANVLARWPGRSGRGSAFRLTQYARRNALKTLASAPVGARALLLGKRVASLVGFADQCYFEWQPVGGLLVAVVPHPSGVNHWWNDPSNRALAAEFFSGLPLAPA